MKFIQIGRLVEYIENKNQYKISNKLPVQYINVNHIVRFYSKTVEYVNPKNEIVDRDVTFIVLARGTEFDGDTSFVTLDSIDKIMEKINN